MIIVMLAAGAFIFLPYSKMAKDADQNQTESEEVTKVCKGRVHSYSTCFAAGMLLSFSFIHILPEVVHVYALYEAKEHAEHGHRRLRALAAAATATNPV